MAKMKIYQSGLGVKSSTIPQIGPTLAQPFELATQLGASVSRLGKAINDIRDKRKATKYENQARKAIKEILPDMYKKFSDFQTSNDIGDVTEFFKVTDYKNYKKNVRWKDKLVKAKVAKAIYDEQIKLGHQLAVSTTQNFNAETKTGIQEDMFGYAVEMAVNDPIRRGLARKKFDAYTENPLISEKFTKPEWDKLKSDTLLQARKLQIKLDTKNNPIDVLERASEIKKEFKNKAEVKVIIDAAKDQLVSKRASFDLQKLLEKKKSEDQQITNFTDILLRFRNKNDPDYIKKLPTLDDITDLEKAGQLNSAQASALLQIYLDPDKVSKRDVFDQVNLQLLIADTVDDVDFLKRSVNFNLDLIKDLDIKDITSFNLLTDKFSQNPELFADFKFWSKQLNTDLGKADGWEGSWGASKKKEKKIRINGVKMFTNLVGDGMIPEDAYFKVLGRLNKSDAIPTIDAIIPPINIGIENLKEELKKNPTNAFNDLRKQLVDIYKLDKDIKTFQHDLAQIDLIEDVVKLRKSMATKHKDEIKDPSEYIWRTE